MPLLLSIFNQKGPFFVCTHDAPTLTLLFDLENLAGDRSVLFLCQGIGIQPGCGIVVQAAQFQVFDFVAAQPVLLGGRQLQAVVPQAKGLGRRSVVQGSPGAGEGERGGNRC